MSEYTDKDDTSDHQKYLEKVKLLIRNKVQEAKLIKEHKEKIKHLTIKLPFKVPFLHTIETRTTAPLTPIQMETLNHLRLKYKSGPYTRSEDRIIKRNWLDFCKNHSLDDDPKPFMIITNISSKAERLKFLRYISKDLDDRLLNSVYKRFRLLYSDLKKGKFTPEENDTIENFMEHAMEKHKFAALSKILKRDRLAIEKRHITLQKGKGRRILWTFKMMAAFLRNLLRLTNLKSYKELKDIEILPKVWFQMEKVMDVPVLALKRGWVQVIYPRLFSKQSFLNLRKTVIESLYESKIDDWKKIDWNEMAKKFDGCNGRFLYKLVKTYMEEKVQDTIKNDAKKST